MNPNADRETDWNRAADRLLEKGLVRKDSDEAMSLRLPGKHQLLGGRFNRKLTVMPLDHSESTFAGSRFHAAIYRVRPDVGSILFSRQTWGSSLSNLGSPMTGVFDEQCRQLGRLVAPLRGIPAQATSDRDEISRETRSQLLAGEQVFLLSEGVLILGHTVERVVFNAELLEKSAKAYLIATATGKPVKKVPLYVRLIAQYRLHKDQKKSAVAYAAGEIPMGFKAY